MPAPRLCALALATALFASCSLALPRTSSVVSMDEAFAEARPELVRALERPGLLPFGMDSLLSGPLVLRAGLAEGAGKGLDATLALEKKTGRPLALFASPLIAKAIVQGGSWSGDPPLFVPEWQGAVPAGLASARSDPVPAYRVAGAAAGAFVAALSKEGGDPSCGVVFAEAASRPRAALLAFQESFAEASGGLPLQVSELAEGGSAPAATEQGAKAAPPPSDRNSAEAAVGHLLEMDMRLLFVALGPSAGAAIQAAKKPGLAIGADFPYPESPASLAFSIHPNEGGLASALIQVSKALRPGKVYEQRLIPSLVSPGPAAASLRAGNRDFSSFLAQASKGPGAGR